MNTIMIGMSRGVVELRNSFRSTSDLFNYFGVSALFLAVAWSLRNNTLPGNELSLGMIFLAGSVGFIAAMGGVVSVGQILGSDREDGTLLRAKLMPHGMPAYLLSVVVHVGLMTLINAAIVLVPGMLIFGELSLLSEASSTLLLVGVLLLGMAATFPLGAILGALLPNPRTSLGLLMLPIMGIVMVSGVFFPMSQLPEWAQWIGLAFPVYWLALGTRSALLPPDMVAGELYGSWQTAETFLVLGLWAVIGFIVAPMVLRRMARRQSGSRMAADRQRALASSRA